MVRVYRERLRPEHRDESIYRYRSFYVPPGAAGLRVRLSYDRVRGVIDLGAFDEAGFRGYSGAARDTFAIARDVATPGYLPGRVDAREWRLLLGLHRIPADGLDYELEVEFGAVEPEPPPPPPPLTGRARPRSLPASRGRAWLAGELHCHSVHSDGSEGVHALANRARAAGLDFMAISDHNTTSHHASLADAASYSGVQLIPAQEVTTERGHANCFGPVGWIDFRESPHDWLAQTHRRGGVMCVNHPARGDCAWRLPLPAVPLVELWHGSWDRRSRDTIEWWRPAGATPVGGSDFHRPAVGRAVGSPTTWVETDGDDVLAGLAARRVAVSVDARGPVAVRRDEAIEVIGADGSTLVGPSGERIRVRGERFSVAAPVGLHLLVDDAERVIALTP